MYIYLPTLNDKYSRLSGEIYHITNDSRRYTVGEGLKIRVFVSRSKQRPKVKHAVSNACALQGLHLELIINLRSCMREGIICLLVPRLFGLIELDLKRDDACACIID